MNYSWLLVTCLLWRNQCCISEDGKWDEINMYSAALVTDPLRLTQITIFSKEVSWPLADNYQCHLCLALLLFTFIIISLLLKVWKFMVIFVPSSTAGTKKIPSIYLNDKFNFICDKKKENHFLYLSIVIVHYSKSMT